MKAIENAKINIFSYRDSMRELYVETIRKQIIYMQQLYMETTLSVIVESLYTGTKHKK